MGDETLSSIMNGISKVSNCLVIVIFRFFFFFLAFPENDMKEREGK